MKEINTYHYISLKLKNPNELARESSLADYRSDVQEAEAEFNKSFKGVKGLITLKVTEGSIQGLLVYTHTLTSKVTAKALTVFSRYLYRDKDWGRFSKEDGKLFVLAEPVKELTYYEADGLLSAFEVNPGDYTFFPDYDTSEDEDEHMDGSTTLDGEELEDFADAQMVPVLEYLIATQHMGSLKSQGDKARAIRQMKTILNRFIYQ